MTFGLVHASYSLPECQAVKVTFFPPAVVCEELAGGVKPIRIIWQNILNVFE